jgi:hypothetical protein
LKKKNNISLKGATSFSKKGAKKAFSFIRPLPSPLSLKKKRNENHSETVGRIRTE